MGAVPRYVLLHRIPSQARVLLRFSGPDAERFLQGTLSADLGDLQHGRAVPATLLTVKGKIVSDAVVVRLPGDGIGMLVPADVADEVQAGLDRHIIMDDVTIARTGDAVALVWPDRPANIDAFETRHPAPGWLLVGTPDEVDAAVAGTEAAAPYEFTAHRIATQTPAWGHEVAPGFFPPEVGLTYAVSYDKGCFLGQEPLARIHARGHVNRMMVRVGLDQAPVSPEPIALAHADRERAGTVTSWAETPDGWVGLAIVHASLAHPDVVLEGDGVGRVLVTSGPLGNDPGVGS